MSKKIIYKNKIAIQNDETIQEINKVTDTNMNEIKEVVNYNADIQIEHQEKILEIEQKEIEQDKNIQKNTSSVEELEKNNLKQDTKIESLQAQTEELEVKTKELQNENMMLKNQIPTGQEVGNSTHIKDSSNLEINWKLNGRHEQETSSDYPSEIKTVGQDINILPNNLESITKNGITATVNKDKSIHFKGTPTAQATFYLFEGLESGEEYTLCSFTPMQTGTYFRIVDGEKTNLFQGFSVNKTKTTFTYNDEFTSGKMSSFVWFASASVGVEYDFVLYPKLVKGTEVGGYSPYGKNGVELKMINKNILPFSYKEGYKTTVGGVTVEYLSEHRIKINGTATGVFQENIIRKNMFDWKKGVAYTLSLKKVSGSITNWLMVHTSFMTGIEDTWNNLEVYLDNNKTITMDNDGYCSRAILYSPQGTVFNDLILEVQLEVGTEATEYSDNENQTVVLPVQQELLEGDYIDEVEHHEWGKIESYNGETIETEYISTTGELTTGATVYYKLAEPIDLELTEEQKEIKEQKLYTNKNTTNIFVSGIGMLSINYKKDLETLFNNINSALLS